MKCSLIAAVANNNVIGHENRLIWHMPADLKHFKSLTMGGVLIMGRKTFESIGSPLKGRITIVLTKQTNYDAKGCLTADSLGKALKIVKAKSKVFIAGGSQIYHQAISLKQSNRIFLTRIYASFDGDAFFPEIDPVQWELTEREDLGPDEKNPYAYSFLTYKRKSHR